MLSEQAIKRHVKIFNDVHMLNGVAVFTHGHIISVYHMGR